MHLWHFSLDPETYVLITSRGVESHLCMATCGTWARW